MGAFLSIIYSFFFTIKSKYHVRESKNVSINQIPYVTTSRQIKYAKLMPPSCFEE